MCGYVLDVIGAQSPVVRRVVHLRLLRGDGVDPGEVGVEVDEPRGGGAARPADTETDLVTNRNHSVFGFCTRCLQLKSIF